ncbi:MAG: hypothetical protein H3C63_04150 [Candidatus Omnitrophica bacterium]|nr:hypothetical protein [bacterium]MBW7938031.1 hypothetical protein [Candidatus Omnitrophota bacterium]MCC6733402.1 hypothetical protein [Candidatus Omnitrophota bacterium]
MTGTAIPAADFSWGHPFEAMAALATVAAVFRKARRECVGGWGIGGVPLGCRGFPIIRIS